MGMVVHANRAAKKSLHVRVQTRLAPPEFQSPQSIELRGLSRVRLAGARSRCFVSLAMAIPLEDTAADIIGKAQRGLGLSDSQLADKAGITAEQVRRLREGEFDAAALPGPS